jgi:SAM-dependent methyltransferase
LRSISERQRDLYQESLDKHGDSTRATHQNDPVTQHLRFERLVKGIAPFLPGSTIHDVGCGFGELGEYLAQREAGCTYSGIEIVAGMAKMGRERLGVDIVVDDFIARDYERSYDFLVASGVFNIPGEVEPGEWSLHNQALIGKMFATATKAIAFNGLTTFSDFRREDLHYWDPGQALSFCQSELSRFCVLDHAYPLYEWTLTVFHQDFVRGAYPQDELAKYF